MANMTRHTAHRGYTPHLPHPRVPRCTPPRNELWRLNEVATQVSEQQARQVAEAAREQDWKLPSFGKELFLGNFRLDLIHPQPKLDAEAVEKGEAFLKTLREFLEEQVDPLQIERDSKIPDEVIKGFQDIGA